MLITINISIIVSRSVNMSQQQQLMDRPKNGAIKKEQKPKVCHHHIDSDQSQCHGSALMDFLLFTRVLGKRKKKVQFRYMKQQFDIPQPMTATAPSGNKKNSLRALIEKCDITLFQCVFCHATRNCSVTRAPASRVRAKQQQQLFSICSPFSSNKQNRSSTNTLFHSLRAYKLRLIKCGQRRERGERLKADWITKWKKIKVPEQNVGQKGCFAAADAGEVVHSWTTSQGPGFSALEDFKIQTRE